MYIIENFSDFARVEYLNRTYGDITKKLVDVDPTHNKKYLQWLIKKSDTLPKDFSEVKDKLKIFSNLKSRNIYDFKSYQDLKKYIDSSNPTEVVFENANVKIIKPLNTQSAITYGSPKWCISNKKNNWFEKYKSKNFNMYIVDVKKDLGLSDKYGDYMMDAKESGLNKIVDEDPKSFQKIGIVITPKKYIEIWNANNYVLDFIYNFKFIKDLGIEKFINKIIK
jgi:hypothetical protein